VGGHWADDDRPAQLGGEQPGRLVRSQSDRRRHHISCRRSQRDKPSSNIDLTYPAI
jgi:hypothetical protein